jgi:hypothetical protein
VRQSRAMQNKCSLPLKSHLAAPIPATKPVLFSLSDRAETNILYHPNPNEAIHILLNLYQKGFDTTISQKTKKNVLP